ncbi:hypothetical protein VNI00_012233 [Paramarasmius palmivorus]|uniref:HpcH/HpaI aldolase/citrate lyase domain-containing protein n=1 Tax=Paramarasmius palmivorus TaxID=297713 RepID=A0AAW0C6H0_9AGAR
MLPFILLFAALAAGTYISRRRKSKYYPLPPGPRRLPIIGNLLSMPKEYEWEVYARWAREYKSDIIHLNVAGTNLVILDQVEVTKELLDKRSRVYSSSHRELQSDDAQIRFRNAQMQSLRAFLNNLHRKGLEDSKRVDIMAELKQFVNFDAASHTHLKLLPIYSMAGSTILSIAYGIKSLPLPQKDPYISAADKALDAFCIAARPGAFLVDALPALKYLPDWFPGAGFKKTAREWNGLMRRMIELPFEVSKQDFVRLTIRRTGQYKKKESDLSPGHCTRGSSSFICQEHRAHVPSGGVDSTLALLSHFFHAMLAFPDVQTKAQDEIDQIVGRNILPTFEDFETGRLPYVTALVKEAFRWRSVAPMGFPHYLAEDDVYNGYMIPRGTIVLANFWSMMHNPDVYPEPDLFKPERFLTSDGKALSLDIMGPELVVFGFGRRSVFVTYPLPVSLLKNELRICPARELAYTNAWMTIASTLAAFRIEKAIDEEGRVVEPSYECKSTLALAPHDTSNLEPEELTGDMTSLTSSGCFSSIFISHFRAVRSRRTSFKLAAFFSSTSTKDTYDLRVGSRVPQNIKWGAHQASLSTMAANPLLDAFKANRTAFGTFITSGNFFFARAVAQASPHIEWICIDCEHGLTSLNPGVSELVAAIHGEGIPTFVRIPATGVSTGTGWQIKYALDAGAKGVVVPMVSTAEKAREVVLDSRFPPVGRRGFGSSYAHGNWKMSAQDYLNVANEHVIVAVQIETKAALDNLEEIAAVDGVDVLLLGPSDLSMALGYPIPSPDPHPEVEKAIQRVLRVSHEKGKKCWMYVSNGEKAAQRAKEGFDMVSVTNDIGILTLGISTQFEDAVRLSR